MPRSYCSLDLLTCMHPIPIIIFWGIGSHQTVLRCTRYNILLIDYRRWLGVSDTTFYGLDYRVWLGVLDATFCGLDYILWICVLVWLGVFDATFCGFSYITVAKCTRDNLLWIRLPTVAICTRYNILWIKLLTVARYTRYNIL